MPWRCGIVAVHGFDAWFVFPRLFINSPEKGCGKSTLLDVLSRLVRKALTALSITPAALFRVIEAMRPTLLLDEADTYLRDNDDLRGVLDAGHRSDGADPHRRRQPRAAPVLGMGAGCTRRDWALAGHDRGPQHKDRAASAAAG
jgi:hypothetical protein